MSQLRVHGFGVSLDGFGAGPDQSLENPLGVGGSALFQWFFATRTFRGFHATTQDTIGEEGGSATLDDDFAAQGFENIGAWILGRNMFGPVRGPWPDDSWKGWWGDEPPYHTPVFVLTHHPRESFSMIGDTTFHFVAGEIHDVLARAREAAGGKDVRLGGGVATIRQYLQASLIDQMHLACSPVLLGSGESLLTGLNLPALGYGVRSHTSSAEVMHVVISKKAE
jgi:dihydrofolate reductase